MEEIYGVIFPIPRQYMNRFFQDNKNVFIKPATLFRSLKPGLMFYFYQSRKDTGIVGEARIKTVTFSEDPIDFFKIFGDAIFLQKSEVEKYVSDNKKWVKMRKKHFEKTKKRPWFAIELENISKFDDKIEIQGFVPISGMYIEIIEH